MRGLRGNASTGLTRHHADHGDRERACRDLGLVEPGVIRTNREPAPEDWGDGLAVYVRNAGTPEQTARITNPREHADGVALRSAR